MQLPETRSEDGAIVALSNQGNGEALYQRPDRLTTNLGTADGDITVSFPGIGVYGPLREKAVQLSRQSNGDAHYQFPGGLTTTLRSADGWVTVSPPDRDAFEVSMRDTVYGELAPLWETAFPGDEDFQEFRRAYTRRVMCEFWREQFDGEMPLMPMPKRMPKRGKLLIRSEVALWDAAFECLKQINFKKEWDYPFPTTNLGFGLLGLILEQSLVCFLLKGVGEGQANAKEFFIRPNQAINKALRDWENPFPLESFSHAFTASCLRLAGQSNSFRAKHWVPLIDARSEFVESVRTGKIVMVSTTTGKQVDRRGKQR